MVSLRRFSLRALFIAITAVAVLFGFIGYERFIVSQQVRAISQIESLGGVPLLVDYREHRAYTVTATQKPRFTFLNYIFGKDYFIYAPAIDLTNGGVNGDKVRTMFPYFKMLRMVEGINEAGTTNICLSMSPDLCSDSKLMSDIEQMLPQCKVLCLKPGRAWRVSMKHRKLRIAWSVTWGTAAVLLIALWVRSYWL